MNCFQTNDLHVWTTHKSAMHNGSSRAIIPWASVPYILLHLTHLWTRKDGEKSLDLAVAVQVILILYRSYRYDTESGIAADLVLHALLDAIDSRALIEDGSHRMSRRIADYLFENLVAVVVSLNILLLPPFSRETSKTQTKSPEERRSPFTPLLLPCKTTHSRVFPKRHSFGYSYLFVGVPIGWHGEAGSLISVDTHVLANGGHRKGWFHVQAGDHLARGSEELDLKGKLHAYLNSQDVRNEEWSFAYLVTAPQFLGYSFNPVSFWYVYSEDFLLKYMILEVNNTFDERRMYLLKASDDNDESTADKSIDQSQGSKRFTNHWAKDFHVSPFNSRKGAYSLSAVDPINPDLSDPKNLQIDNTITLKSSKDHSKLVARVFSTAPSLDPRTLSLWQTTRFILSWWWVGFVTLPRILKEAGKLFFKRKLHVWYRPEVDRKSIGRSAAAEESTVAPFFTAHISHLTSHVPTPIVLTLDPGIPSLNPLTLTSPSTPAPATHNTPTLTLRILSPAFYTTLTTHPSLLSALSTAALHPDPKARTVHASSPRLLRALAHPPAAVVHDMLSTAEPEGKSASRMFDSLRWRVLSGLRGALRPSETDAFVRARFPAGDAARYRSVAVRMVLAEKFTLGFVGLVDLVDLLMRAGLVWLGTRVMGMRGVEWERVVAGSAVHVWGVMKG